MKFRQSLVLLPAFALTACNGGNEKEAQTLRDSPDAAGSVVYSYPADGQSAVSTRADLVLRFSHTLSEQEETLQEKILLTAGGDSIDFSVTRVDGGQSLKLTPKDRLVPGTEYTLSFEGGLQAGDRLIPTPNATGPEGIQFSTRGALSGSAQAQVLDDEFQVDRMIPAEGSDFLPVDFSTLRLQLTQPVHPDWRELGGSIQLLDSDNEPVPATVLARGRAVTVDPCIADTPEGCGKDTDLLNPEGTYTLEIQDLPGRFGGTLDYSADFTARDTAPDASRTTLYQQIIDSGLNEGASEEDAERSILNGQIINGITLKSVLQGEAGPSQQTADLYAQLAYAPAFDGDIGVPLRIARNSKLASSSLDIRINGIVPVINESTGETQSTGDINVTMLAAATGYLLPNPFSDSASAPRHVRLWMDIAMSTEKAMPNAALSQDVMGLELTGIAQVQDGVLTIDAIGVVEPRLLGLEDTEATIAFRIQADTDVDVQMDALDNREPDTNGPELVSWMPGPEDDPAGDRQAIQGPGDPVILFFDEPLDRQTLTDGLTMSVDGQELETGHDGLRIRSDGTSVILNPNGGLQYGKDYSLHISNSLTDLAGNSATSQTLNFSLPEIGDLSAPMVMSTYPGFPCVTEELDLERDSHGYCLDRPSADPEVNRPDGQERDELFVTTMPANRPIKVTFSNSMRLASLNENTFRVERVDEGTGEGTPVEGRLEKHPRKLIFHPESPWETNELYRYTLVAEHPDDPEILLCLDPTSPVIMCGENRAALNTDILVDPEDIGGPDMVIYFRGSDPVQHVMNPLQSSPVRDVNANLLLDCTDDTGTSTPGAADCLEPFPLEDADANPDGSFPTPRNAARLAFASTEIESEFVDPNLELKGRVGCPPTDEQDCHKNKFLYQTLHLNTEIIGPTTDPETGKEGVKVILHPSLIVTTPISVYLSEPLGEQPTGPQILRMRYAKADPDCSENCRRDRPIEGIIIQDDSGRPLFKSDVELTLDAPNLSARFLGNPLEGTQHNLFSYPFVLRLDGGISFYDDGRMQIRQANDDTASAIDANVTYEGSGGTVLLAGLDLELPSAGVLLNLISQPVKEIPAEIE